MRTMISVLRSFAGSTWPRAFAAGLSGLIVAFAGSELLAQQPGNNRPGQNIQRAVVGPVGNQQNQNPLFAGPNNNQTQNNNRRGGSQNADFDSLIDLIVSTVATDTWAENGGGQAEVRPFPGGVLVDAAGMLRLKSKADATKLLGAKRGTAPTISAAIASSARQASPLRYVSLP